MDGWRVPGDGTYRDDGPPAGGAYGNDPGPAGGGAYGNNPGPAGGGAYRNDPGPVGGVRPGPGPGPWGDARSWGPSNDIRLGNVDVTRPERPATMRSAVALMYGGAGLTVLSTVMFFVTKGQLADSLADANPGVSQAAIDNAISRLQGREIVRTVFGVSLWIWMATVNGKGRSWARVVATVFGVINLISIVLTLAIVAGSSAASDSDEIDQVVDYTMPYMILAGVMAVLAVVTLVQLYRSDSSRFYEDTSRWRAAMVLRGY